MPDWLIAWLVKLLGERVLSWLGRAHDLRLTAHRANLIRPGSPSCVFVTATNRHNRRDAVVTHVWFELRGPREVHVLNPERPLPRRLRPDDVWETWIEEHDLPRNLEGDVRRMACARLSTGLVVPSVPNEDVPDAGFVPGA